MRRGILPGLAAVVIALTACRSYFGEPLDPSAPNVVPHALTASAATITTSVPKGFLSPGVEGSVLFLRLTDGDANVILDRPFGWGGDSQHVPPGSYRLDAYARGCDGNCGRLSAPSPPFCTQEITLAAQAQLVVDISGGSLAPGLTCTIRSP